MLELKTVLDMRDTLRVMNSNLTPYSSKIEYKRYLDNLNHYKKIVNLYITHLTIDLDESIEKTTKIIRGFDIQAENNNERLINQVA